MIYELFNKISNLIVFYTFHKKIAFSKHKTLVYTRLVSPFIKDTATDMLEIMFFIRLCYPLLLQMAFHLNNEYFNIQKKIIFFMYT